MYLHRRYTSAFAVCLLIVIFASRARAQVSPDAMGINPNDLTDPNLVPAVADHVQNLGARWVRLEIINSQPPDYWSWVVDQFRDRGINVLGLLTNQTWSGRASDPDTCQDGPTDFGWSLIN